MLVSNLKKEFLKFLEYLKLKFINKKSIIPLAPRIVNSEYINEYLKSLHAAVKNKDLYNIAVTGNYGTGKSSIIKTYLNKLKLKRKNYLTINISSYFKIETVEGNNNILEKEELEIVDRIESAIVRQILYINSSDEIIESTLKRVTGKKKRILNCLSLNFIFYGILFYLLFLFYNNNKEIFKFILPYFNFFAKYENYGVIFLNIIFSLFIISVMYIISSIVPIILSGLKTLRIKLGANEIKIGENSDVTFNKNLGEIITFFSYNKACKIIIFEDIDRFCEDITLKVIEDLKNLNYKINCSNSVSQKVTFIYSFKEDIFKCVEDKSKFYDHVVSVMPISSFYNSKDILLELLKEKNCKNIPDKKLINIVTNYIFDTRTLISIVMDFELYQSILKTINYNKVFAIAIFKNVYYKEYGNILLKDNEIETRFKLFDEKKKYLISVIEEKNIKLQDTKEKVMQEKEKNKKELKQLLWMNSYKDQETNYFTIKDKIYKYEDFIDENFDIQLLKENQCLVNGIYELDYKHFNNKENFFKDYEMSKNRKLDDINNILLKNLREIDKIKRMNIKELYNKYLNGVEKDLLDELIYNKYIEIDYLDYITAPSASGMTGSDNKFIFDVKHETISYLTKISSYQLVIEQIEDYFDSIHVLNIYLVEFLINNLDKYYNYYHKIVEQYKMIERAHIDFLHILVENNIEVFYQFINSIKNQKIDIWNNINQINSSSFIKKKVFEAILKTRSICNCMKKYSQKSFNIFANNYFNNTLNTNLDLLLKNEIARKNITTYIGYNLRVKYLGDFNEVSKKYLIDKGLYEYNDSNIKEILKFIPNDLNNTTISRSEIGKVFLYHIEKNFKNFYEEFYKNKDITINNNKLIKNILKQKLSQEIKKEIYHREKFQLAATEIDNYLVTDTLKYNHFFITWKEILKFNNTKRQDLLIEILIKNRYELFSQDIIKNNLEILKQNINIIKLLVIELLKRSYLEEVELLIKNIEIDIKITAICKLRDSAIILLFKYNLLKYSKITLNRIAKIDKNMIINFIGNWYKEIKSARVVYKSIIGNSLYEEMFFKCRDIELIEKIKIILDNYEDEVDFKKKLYLLLIPEKFYCIPTSSKLLKKVFFDKSKKYFILHEVTDKHIRFSIKKHS